jgi:nitrous oxidase accessory protein
MAAISASMACAETIIVSPSQTQSLQEILDQARVDDVIHLGSGEHRGPVIVDKGLTVEGAPGAVIVGSGQGSVVRINAPNTVLRRLEIRGSGKNIETLDSGVYVAATARAARIEDNTLVGNLYGINLQGAENAIVSGNRIIGAREGRSTEAGNGVHVWNSPGAKVIGNDISHGRDGIYVTASRRNVFSGNRFKDLRFAVHYMYTNDSEVSSNESVGNIVGYAIMFSRRLTVTGNVSDGDRAHGLLLNSARDSRISDNVVIGRMQPRERWTTAGRLRDSHGVPSDAGSKSANVGDGARLGPEKCVFIYSATRNALTGNWFEGCAIGVHFTAGSEGNELTRNAFIRNRNQVKYVGTRYLEWSTNGIGNYWSDNTGYDLDGNGISDAPYRPNDMIDRVLWTTPQAKILVNSPAVQIIRWAQNRFPALLPGGVIDSHPLMTPPHRKRQDP